MREHNIKRVSGVEKMGKVKRSGENGENKRSGKGYQGNKVNLLVRENSGFEVNVYHHIIYKC